jgi:hypothetical protein
MGIEWPEQRTNAAELRRRLLAACARLRVPVVFKARLQDNAVGLAYRDRIEVCDSLAVIESAGTLIHELAHECLHFNANGDCGYSQELEEAEANEVERRVLAHYGIMTAQGIKRPSPRVTAAVDRIVSEVEQETAAELLAVLERFNRAVERTL